jgi:hypothetical protein
VIDEEASDIGMSLLASCNERRDAIVVRDVGVSAEIDEELGDFGMTLFACPD